MKKGHRKYQGDWLLVRVSLGSSKEYTYTWPRDEEPLKVGDRVVLPSNWLSDAPIGTVRGFGSDYEGLPDPILRRAPDENADA